MDLWVGEYRRIPAELLRGCDLVPVVMPIMEPNTVGTTVAPTKYYYESQMKHIHILSSLEK